MVNLSRVSVFVKPQMFCAFATFVTDDLTAVLDTCMDIYMTYPRTKFNVPSPDGASVISFKPPYWYFTFYKIYLTNLHTL
jgi:hypothetical protein